VLDHCPCHIRMSLYRRPVLDKVSFEVFEIAKSARSSIG
jgi:hypothetical protein